MAPALSPEKTRLAMECINAWRAGPEEAVVCPECEAPGLKIEDRSARPFTEWYRVHCEKCGLDQTIAIPMAPPATY